MKDKKNLQCSPNGSYYLYFDKSVIEKAFHSQHMLPKHLRRTSLWTLELERQGLIKRVACRVKGSSALLLVSTENLLNKKD
jgi:hypothetical protein